MSLNIALCCPGKPMLKERADAVLDLAGSEYADISLNFHLQCFEVDGHFAGNDTARLSAFLECANDPDFDAVWFAMGGYGSNRIVGDALGGLKDAAMEKSYLGYSDCGTLLGALYKHGIGRPVHAPLAGDIRREGGADAVRRVLDFLCDGTSGLEPSLDGRPTVAFNLTTLAMLVGTEYMPDLSGHVVMIEEVAEHLYAVDRLLFHVTQNLPDIAGLRLGRISEVPENDRPFGSTEEEIARYWCAKSGIDYLGRADIGHDAMGKIVPFGLAGSASRS